MSTQPLLSIVIANYNYGRFLDEAIQSVLSQSCDDYELIIIDGASTDNSVEVIKKYADKLAYWCSEPDKGQSDAFNKGFARARGKYLTWLNADDVMLPGVIEKLKKANEKHPECEWFVGGCFWLDPEMRIINCGWGRPFSEIRYREGDVGVWGPSSFFTKRLLDAVGGVDVRFCYSMDTDLWLRFAYKENARYRPFCKYAWGFRFHSDSKTAGNHISPDGKFDTNEAAARERIDAKHREQCKQECAWRDAYFKRKNGSWFTHLISVSWWNVLLARLDLLKWRGKKYTEVM